MALMDALEGMSEEEQAQFLQLMGMDMSGEMSGLDKQMTMAEQLRNTAGPEGRQAGGMYVAANPLEFLGAGMQQYQGQQKMNALQTKQDVLRQQGTDMRSKVMGSMIPGQ